VVGAAAPAAARQADGTLGLIQTPNNGLPALVQASGTFSVELLAPATLSLVGAAGEFPLGEASWTTTPGGRVRGACRAPAQVPAGAYALRATGTEGETADENVRAVYIIDPPGDYYAVAHVSDTHIGRVKQGVSVTPTVERVFAEVNASGAAFALVTGDVTDNGEPAQFVEFLRALDTCTLPTFVCVGNHDRAGLWYERFFGPLDYAFTFGPDGYLVFDTKDFVTAPDLGPQPGDLEVLRRQLKPSRYTIGASHRYESAQGMRSQLSLFVDNPLDLLLFGHWHRENSEEQKAVPWGTTRISVVPAALDGHYRIIDITAAGPRLRPFSTVTAP